MYHLHDKPIGTDRSCYEATIATSEMMSRLGKYNSLFFELFCLTHAVCVIQAFCQYGISCIHMHLVQLYLPF
jgi:hypothetical protein